VRTRLDGILERLGDRATPRETTALRLAADLHDTGKEHPRFQTRMGRRSDEPLLAKPRPGHTPDRGDGWRHEQLSAAFAAHRSDGDALVVALVGAHHGRGRPLFDRGTAVLDGWQDCPVDVAAAAAQLFGPRGTYELLRAQARDKVGVLRLAWLEALLRCADMQVSREGR
jgi:CRISPR-associated endonuclease/helicase Cas3